MRCQLFPIDIADGALGEPREHRLDRAVVKAAVGGDGLGQLAHMRRGQAVVARRTVGVVAPALFALGAVDERVFGELFVVGDEEAKEVRRQRIERAVAALARIVGRDRLCGA